MREAPAAPVTELVCVCREVRAAAWRRTRAGCAVEVFSAVHSYLTQYILILRLVTNWYDASYSLPTPRDN